MIFHFLACSAILFAEISLQAIAKSKKVRIIQEKVKMQKSKVKSASKKSKSI